MRQRYYVAQPSITRRLVLVYITVFISLLQSCEDFIDIAPPKTELIRETVFKDDDTAIATVSSIYHRMISLDGFTNGGQLSLTFLCGLYSDELNFFSTNIDRKQFYDNSLIPTNPIVTSIWGDAYNFIYSTNSIIEGLSHSSNISDGVKSQLLGEAKFIRAFCHFYLLNLFGDIPYVTSTDHKANSVVERLPSSNVYDLIIIDLIEASDLLSDSYVTTERVRPNKWAAKALLSRVYLFIGDWPAAETYASEIISHTPMYSLTALNGVFLKNSSETIWQLMPLTNYTPTGANFILTGKPAYTALNETLLNAFEPGDQRRSNWTGSLTVGGVTYYFPYKYKSGLNSNAISEYSTVFRLAEQYLIRAEARAHQDELQGAISDLDVIRQRAGLNLVSNSSPSISKSDLLLAIERERRIELFAEWAHRWFDLVRTNRVNAVLDLVKPGWDITDALLPIPESERLVNTRLSQNAGYPD